MYATVNTEPFAFKFHPNGSIFSSVPFGEGLIHSTDGGNTWNPVITGFFSRYFAITPQGHIFVVSSTYPSSVYRSTDDGATWINTGFDTRFDLASLESNANGEIFVEVFEDKYYRSTDDGVT